MFRNLKKLIMALGVLCKHLKALHETTHVHTKCTGAHRGVISMITHRFDPHISPTFGPLFRNLNPNLPTNTCLAHNFNFLFLRENVSPYHTYLFKTRIVCKPVTVLYPEAVEKLFIMCDSWDRYNGSGKLPKFQKFPFQQWSLIEHTSKSKPSVNPLYP